jgi:hypothetical protein
MFCSIAFMKETINFSTRHESVDALLVKLFKELKQSNELPKFCVLAANKLNVHPNTVKNYLLGTGKDGYLKDCIFELGRSFTA